jgi:hypothetical protein
MHLGLSQNELLISPLSPEEIFRRLEISVKPANFQSHTRFSKEDYEYLFNGKCSLKGFSISKVVSRPDNFLPRISGKVEGASNGSLISLRFSLFPSVKVFFSFWIFLMSMLSLSLYHQNNDLFSFLMPVVVLLVSYLVVRSRFQKALKKSRKELLRLIT